MAEKKVSGSSIDYADGSEKALARIFSAPDFDEDLSWRKHRFDWALYYHLSPLRKNLFRWIEWERSGLKILELGAGCGALTSYFGTLPSVHKITAVEGSRARADLIRKRCDASGKVEVVVSNIRDFKTDEKFDLVLLIGVLEYSGKYVKGDDPFAQVLEKACSFLSKDGSLVLAIENQLGHKYLAGHDEDHYGRRFEGVSNYPHYEGMRTFDKATLDSLLSSAGLASRSWFYPFPDYKLPNVILSEQAFGTPGFDWLSLLDLPTESLFSKGKSLFNEKEFLRSISLNANPSFFMNSFMVIARQKADAPAFLTKMLAVKLNTLRDEAFKTLTYFKPDPKGSITVTRKRPGVAEESRDEVYHQGYKNLGSELVDSLFLGQNAKAALLIQKWYDTLKGRLISGDHTGQFTAFAKDRLAGADIYAGSMMWLPHGDLELTPTNLLFSDRTSDVRVIDLEWNAWNTPMPLRLVIDRGMHDTVTKLCRLTGLPETLNGRTWNFSEQLLTLLPKEITSPDLLSHAIFDAWLHSMVHDKTSRLSKKQRLSIRRDMFWRRKTSGARCSYRTFIARGKRVIERYLIKERST